MTCSTPYGEETREPEPDAEAAEDADVDAMDPCDQDRDGFRAANALCGGDDCDDGDPRAHPNADFVAAAPPATTNGDWNCDGVIEKQWATHVSCFSVGGSSACDTLSGFLDDPACGESGRFVQCELRSGSRCVPAAFEIRRQSCR